MSDDPYFARPWARHYLPGWPLDLEPRFDTLLDAFTDAVRQAPRDVVLSYFGATTTYAELDELSDRLAAWMRGHGVAAGDRVAIVLQNVPAFPISAIAAWKLGTIPVPGNPMYKEDELARIFADSRPALLLCHPDHAATGRAALDRAGLAAVSILTAGAGDRAGPRAPREFLASDGAGQNKRLEDVLARAPRPFTRVLPSGDDIGLMLYTSGTTGVPKAAMLRHSSIAFNGQAMGQWCEVDECGRILGVAPLFHITGFVSHLALAIVARAALILHFRFEPKMVLETIRHERPTFTVGAITAFNALLALDGTTPDDFSSFRRVYSGGAAIAPGLRDTIEARLGVTIHNCYGMTETSSPTHGCPPGAAIPVDPVSGALSIGIPTFSTEVRVVDEHGSPVLPGSLGEIWMRGPQVMTGYWNKPEESAAALHDGWMRSGDVGFMDEDGWFYLVDRQKDMINASGFKVWPREIEDVLHLHGAVREAAVVGTPDAYRGETVLAVVSLRADAEIGADELFAHCRERLAAYKCPRKILIMDELPKTPTGKIQRNLLREAATRNLSS